MPKVTINTFKSHGEPGSTEMHFGYVCTVGPEGELVADVPEDLIQIELDANRVTLLEEAPKKPKSIDDMKAGELIAYAAENKLDIGGLVAQSGKEKILEAVKAAISLKKGGE